MSWLAGVRKALSALNPDEVRDAASRPFRLLLEARTGAAYAAIEDFLLPGGISRQKRLDVMKKLARAQDAEAGTRFNLTFYEQGLGVPEGWEYGKDAFPFSPREPERLPPLVLEKRDDLGLALARAFPPFREAVAKKTIHTVARENAMFSLLTALPNVVPNAFELPWAVGEFASDTTVLTANQVRMAFLLAAASDREVGYTEQRSEIGSIVAGAWGWRTVARNLAGKIPFGGGLIPKAAIAYAGTYVVGLSLERIYRVGYALTREERDEAYDKAFRRGKEVAVGLLEKVRKKQRA
jgi:hypothetical protein